MQLKYESAWVLEISALALEGMGAVLLSVSLDPMDTVSYRVHLPPGLLTIPRSKQNLKIFVIFIQQFPY